MPRILLLLLRSAVCQLSFARKAARIDGAARNYPAPVEGDYVIPNFHFRSGEVLPELKFTIARSASPVRDSAGMVRNAVLIGHGTGEYRHAIPFATVCQRTVRSGQLADATRYFIILADGIGHGNSSKPSDGLHARFPHYTYDDMVAAQYELLTKKLGVNHLRLVMGTSMGGMHTWVWGETYPDFMDALMPLASNPVEIAGRNRIWRRMAMDAIRDDPEWLGGEYKTQPMRALVAAENLLLMAGSAPLFWQKQAPTREAADKFYATASKRQWRAWMPTICSISSTLRANTTRRQNSRRSKRRWWRSTLPTT